MPSVDVQFDFRKLLGWTKRAERQLPFALSRAINQSAKDALFDQRKKYLPQTFTIRNTFMAKKVMSMEFATKTMTDIKAVVGPLNVSKGRGDDTSWTKYHVIGGTRTDAKRKVLAVPIGARAKKHMKTTKGKFPGRLLKGKQGDKHFVSKDGRRLYRRMQRGPKRLKLQYQFTRATKIKKAWPLVSQIDRTVRRVFLGHMKKSLLDALA